MAHVFVCIVFILFSGQISPNCGQENINYLENSIWHLIKEILLNNNKKANFLAERQLSLTWVTPLIFHGAHSVVKTDFSWCVRISESSIGPCTVGPQGKDMVLLICLFLGSNTHPSTQWVLKSFLGELHKAQADEQVAEKVPSVETQILTGKAKGARCTPQRTQKPKSVCTWPFLSGQGGQKVLWF